MFYAQIRVASEFSPLVERLYMENADRFLFRGKDPEELLRQVQLFKYQLERLEKDIQHQYNLDK